MHEKYKDIIEKDTELKKYYFLKDFDYKYSFGYVAWDEAKGVFKCTKNPIFLIKGLKSIIRGKK